MTHHDLHSQSPKQHYSQHYSPAHRPGHTAHPGTGTDSHSEFLPPTHPRAAALTRPNRPSAPFPNHPSPSHGYPTPSQGNAHPHQPALRRRKRTTKPPRSRALLAGGGVGMLALAALIVVPKPAQESLRAVSDVCQEKVAPQSVLSRGELSQLLAIPERSSKEAVQQVVDAPYCTLSPAAIREGALAEREAYPLEFDPQTWLVVLYEEGEYAGYDFSFYRE